MSFKILVADDNIHDRHDPISDLPAMLREVGFEVVATADGEAAYDLVFETRPDLVVLDLAFGTQHRLGFEICEAIRLNDPDIPIILITSVNTLLEDILEGFAKGANDYVVRPRDNREIIARIRANLPPQALLVDNYLCIDLVGSQVFIRKDGQWQEVHMPRLEFELLKFLVINAGLIMLTPTLIAKLWEKEVSDDVLAVLIHRLREKIEPDPVKPVYIETIKRYGYRFNGKLVHFSQRSCKELIS